MNIFNKRLQECRKNKGFSQRELAKSLNVAASTLNHWEKGLREPNLQAICKMVEILEIDSNYLLGIEDKKNLSHISEIDFKYNQLDEHGKKIVKTLLEQEYKRIIPPRTSYKEPTLREIINLKLPDMPASAGTGINLTEDSCETINVIYDAKIRKADFALRISGDSMEPTFYDGDIIAVERTPSINAGEIGIFIINNEGFVKKLGKGKLISINNKYSDILFNEYDNITCIGRVLDIVTLAL